MKRVVILWDEMNDMGFGVEVAEENLEKAKELVEKGYGDWLDLENYPEYDGLGYAEPAGFLLQEAEIEYRLLGDDEITDPENPDLFNGNLNPEVIRFQKGVFV